MCVQLGIKFQVSIIILMGFRPRWIPKIPLKLGLIESLCLSLKIFKKLNSYSILCLQETFYVFGQYAIIAAVLTSLINPNNFKNQKQITEAAVRRYFSKQVFLEISQYSQQITCVGVSFKKVAGLNASNVIKKRLQHRCSPVNFAKFLRTAFFIENLRWLLLE